VSRTYLCIRIDPGRHARRTAVLYPEGEPYGGILRLASDRSGSFGLEIKSGGRYTICEAVAGDRRSISIEDVMEGSDL
jgi:hypothetical protein